MNHKMPTYKELEAIIDALPADKHDRITEDYMSFGKGTRKCEIREWNRKLDKNLTLRGL